MPKGIPSKNYTPEFKKLVIEAIHKEGLNYRGTARQFEMNDRTRITSWGRIYLTEGPKGLAAEQRGRACASGGTQKGPAKLLPKAEEDPH